MVKLLTLIIIIIIIIIIISIFYSLFWITQSHKHQVEEAIMVGEGNAHER
jgi:uncharacterized protein YpmB